MALWWRGSSSKTSASLVIRAEDTSVISADVNGKVVSINADTNINDGVVVLEFSGLSSGTKYEFNVLKDGSLFTTASIKTEESIYPIRIGYGSCLRNNTAGNFANIAIKKYNIDSFFFLGDFGYPDTVDSSSGWGGLSPVSTFSSVANVKSASLRNEWHRYALNIPGVTKLCKNCSNYYMQDDHESVNDWRNSVEVLEEQVTGALGNVTMIDVQETLAACFTSHRAYNQGNPINSDSEADANATYFRVTKGSAEIFVLDCTLYKTTWEPADSNYDANNVTMLGAKQVDWLKSRLATSVAKNKIILSPKRTKDDIDAKNVDSWIVHASFIAELEGIISYIDDSVSAGNPDLWVEPGGVSWGCGDRHNFYAYDDGVHVSVGASPMDRTSNHKIGSANADIIYRPDATSGTTNIPHGGFGLIEIYEDYVTYRILNEDGKMWFGPITVESGKNTHTIPELKAVI